MRRKPHHEGMSMGQALLSLYERAIRERQLAVAERLLRALEELASLEPKYRQELDQAYLLVRECSAGVQHQ